MKKRDVLAIFNRGRISRHSLARTDVNRVALSAQEQTNWMPRSLGSMSLRPGTGYVGTLPGLTRYMPFMFSRDDTALLEMTDSLMRVWVDGDTLLERAAVSTTITNGTFTSDLTGWTDADEGGTTSEWVTGYMSLLGAGAEEARRRQTLSILETDRNDVHALRIVVVRGPLILRIGTTAGDDDILAQTVLRTGTHSIAFRPTSASVVIELASSLKYPTLVDSIAIEAPGTFTLPTPWGTDNALLRWHQINNVIFVAADGYQQRRIERRDNGSWSIVLYEPSDGPFLTENTAALLLEADDISGAVTLTASRALFRSGDVGRLYRLTSQGQIVSDSFASESTFTDEIRVTGVGNNRDFTVKRTGTWSGTLRLQRSIGAPGAWVTIGDYVANGTATFNDDLDNVEAYYRIGFGAGDYTSGTAVATLESTSGSITGVVRVTAFTSATSVNAVVLKDLGGTGATEIWAAGAWGGAQGWPTAVALYEGRIWWFGRGRAFGSVSDAFESFDPDIEGDSGPINRAIGDTADRVNFALPLQRMIVGTDVAELSLRSTSFDEPLTPTNFNVKEASTDGSTTASAVKMNKRGFFISGGGRQAMELVFDLQANDYGTTDLTVLIPEMFEESPAVSVTVQKKPDVRLHFIREDGTVAMLIRDPAEDVLCWVDWETDGVVEDIAVLPGAREDRVFYAVRRTINDSTARYHEEAATEYECRGATVSKLADCHLVYTGPATSTITGLSHLEGETVTIWGDGVDMGTAVVASGAVTLSDEVRDAVVGLSYRARYKSAKLAGETQLGTSLAQRQRIDRVAFILADTHKAGLRFGPDFDTMDGLPGVEGSEEVADDYIWEAYDEGMTEFPGEWSVDARVCLEATAPKPCTVMGAVFSIERVDHV